MSTTILELDVPAAQAKLPSASYGAAMWAADRAARQVAAVGNCGVLTGWQMTVAISTVTAGAGLVGPFHCQTATPQAISGLVAGRNYVYARANGGSPASGTIAFVARTTSAALLNPDGATYAVRLGYLQRTAGAISGVYNAGSALFPRQVPWTVALNRLVHPDGSTGATTSVALVDSLRISGTTSQYRTRTLTLKDGMITGLATTGAWTAIPAV